MSWWHRGFTWKPWSSLTKEKTPMKLASGFCIPEPLPVHTGIKGRQVRPLIRFLFWSRVDEKCADLHKPFISYLFLVGVTVRSVPHQRFPLGTSTKRANSKRANHRLSADDGPDRCLQCLGFQHTEDAFVDDSCACCGRMSMTSLRSCLSFLKGLAPSAATRARENLSLALWEIWGWQ